MPSFFSTYDVVADSPEEALAFVRELDGSDSVAILEIESSEALEPRPDDPKGVYDRGGRAFYDQVIADGIRLRGRKRAPCRG